MTNTQASQPSVARYGDVVKLRLQVAPAVRTRPGRTPRRLPVMQSQSSMLSADARREYIRERYRRDGERAVAEALGITCRAVKNVAWRLGLLEPQHLWTIADDDVLRAAYSVGLVPPGFLNRLADRLGRSRIAVALRASRLGLASHSTPHMAPEERKMWKAQYAPDERRHLNSERTKKLWAERGHPRGALGMKHTSEAKVKMAAASRKAWSDPASGLNTPEERQRRSNVASRNAVDRIFVSGAEMYSRAAHGRRPDLENRYFRSAWEANYARFLNLMLEQGVIASWEYEVRTFWFEAVRRGVRSYTPDFRVVFPDGHHEWHEVKGWMDPKSKTKLNRMAEYYPLEIVKVIDKTWFSRAVRTGLAGAIAGWERRK